MPNVFPTLSFGEVAKVSTSVSHRRDVTVHKFLNMSEQRYVSSHETSPFELHLTRLNGYDYSQVLDFFIQMRGAFVDASLINTFSLTLDGVTYPYCAFEDDTFEVSEALPNLYDVVLRCRQMRRS